ncbi:MAG: DUF983 domain-containing protein [Cucumibacter sp.]
MRAYPVATAKLELSLLLATIFVPGAVLLNLALLRPVKGAIVAPQWALRMHEFGGGEPTTKLDFCPDLYRLPANLPAAPDRPRGFVMEPPAWPRQPPSKSSSSPAPTPASSM